MKNGATVAAFERAFADYVGADYAIACANGTVTLQAALVAFGAGRATEGPCRVAVPPLTMSATTIAALNVGAIPVFHDVDPKTWLMDGVRENITRLGVSLYGLHMPYGAMEIDDAAQTLRTHDKSACFTSYSFQHSKVLSLGEGGMLVTDSPSLAARAREYLSLGYQMAPNQARIDPATLKSPTFKRHHSLGINGRMNDLTAALALSDGTSESFGSRMDWLKKNRQDCASLYRDAITGCEWLTPQFVPDGWEHSWWTFAVATDTPERCLALLDAVEKHGGERPYPAWALTFDEPAFKHLAPPRASDSEHVRICRRAIEEHPAFDWRNAQTTCPVAESLQPRLAQFQTNRLDSATQNAAALRKAIEELS